MNNKEIFGTVLLEADWGIVFLSEANEAHVIVNDSWKDWVENK